MSHDNRSRNDIAIPCVSGSILSSRRLNWLAKSFKVSKISSLPPHTHTCAIHTIHAIDISELSTPKSQISIRDNLYFIDLILNQLIVCWTYLLLSKSNNRYKLSLHTGWSWRRGNIGTYQRDCYLLIRRDTFFGYNLRLFATEMFFPSSMQFSVMTVINISSIKYKLSLIEIGSRSWKFYNRLHVSYG